MFSLSPELKSFSMLVVLLLHGLLAYATMQFVGILPPMFNRRLDAALILRALAFCAMRDKPLEIGLRALADHHPRRRVRRRLRGLLSGLADGGDWCDSLWKHRLISRAETAVLKSAARADNLPWAMKELADGAQRRYFYRQQAMIALLTPWVVLAVGAVVFLIVIACFYPLVRIIEGLV